MEDVAKLLKEVITGSVKTAEPLSRHTSFGIGGPADLFLKPQNAEELVRAVSLLKQKGINYFVLGSGTNILVGDRGYRGAVICLAGEFNRFSYEGHLVKCGAAVRLPLLVKDACNRELTNLEFAIGIPGTLGGALVMNAGAHGRAIGDLLLDVQIIDDKVELHTIEKEDLQFTYRKSNFPAGSIICSARLQLSSGKKQDIVSKCHECLETRKIQPRLPSAGCIFKNPPCDSAGRLLEAAGLKGYREGSAQISSLHANFIVNNGEATAAEVISLIELARSAVRDHFGIELELEVEVLGE